MLDISKCPGTDCPRKESCFRYTKPDRVRYQSWLTMKICVPDVEKCKWYWPLSESETKNYLHSEKS